VWKAFDCGSELWILELKVRNPPSSLSDFELPSIRPEFCVKIMKHATQDTGYNVGKVLP